MKRIWVWLIMSGILLSGCATLDVSDSEQIRDNEGVLLTSVHGVSTNGKLHIHADHIGLPYAIFEVVDGVQLRAVKVKSAEHLRFSSYRSGNRSATFRNQKFLFSIGPGTITYIGDIYIRESDGYPASVQLVVQDREAETLAEARQRFPSLFSRYRYVKGVAIKPPVTDEK